MNMMCLRNYKRGVFAYGRVSGQNVEIQKKNRENSREKLNFITL